MSDVLKIKKPVEEGINEFLKFLLESDKVKGIFTLKKTEKTGSFSYSLITDVEAIKNAAPLSPLMPANAGKILSDFSLKEVFKEPVAAVVRPCELRAFIELVKRTQCSMENIYLISSTCAGVFPLNSVKNGKLNNLLPKYWEAVKKSEILPSLRPTCNACEHFIPSLADITIAVTGNKNLDQECCLHLNTSKGEELASGAPGNETTEKLDDRELSKLKELRQKEREKSFAGINGKNLGLTGMVKTFAACLSCHGCRQVCPICFCTLCDFDSKTHEDKPSHYESELKRKGGCRVPSGTLYFHTGRMIHMAVSCVNCGMCSDVCPVDIPVAGLFSMVGESLQKLFDYLPGKDPEEPAPCETFIENEFADLGE